jgi:hypothetical protein
VTKALSVVQRGRSNYKKTERKTKRKIQKGRKKRGRAYEKNQTNAGG